jgi:hypothetical protein
MNERFDGKRNVPSVTTYGAPAEPQGDSLLEAHHFLVHLLNEDVSTDNEDVKRLAGLFQAAEQRATREALEMVASKHVRCAACEQCQCQHRDPENILKGSASAWQQHIRTLSAPAQAAPSTTATFRPTDPRETYDVPAAPQPDYSIRFSTAEEAQRAATILARPNDLPIGWPGAINLPQPDRLAETPTEVLCGTVPNVITSMNEAILHTAKIAPPSEEALLPDREWDNLCPDSQHKLQTWFRLATERLQLILDEPAPPPLAAQVLANAKAWRKRPTDENHKLLWESVAALIAEAEKGEPK